MSVVCRDSGVLFLAVPRTGSTGLEGFFIDRLGGVRLPEEDVRAADGSLLCSSKHATVPQLVAHTSLTWDDVRRMTVVAGIRNPLDSVASLYAKQRHRYGGRDRWVQDLGETARIERARSASFGRWLVSMWGLKHVLGCVLRPHSHGLHEDYLRHADVVLRLECLADDLGALMTSLGLPTRWAQVPMVNETVERVGSGSRLDPLYARIISNHYSETMKRFGYSAAGWRSPR